MKFTKWTNEKSQQIKEHQSFIEKQNHCVLCGERLEIKTESMLSNYNLKEEAYCKNRNIKTRVKEHKMH